MRLKLFASVALLMVGALFSTAQAQRAAPMTNPSNTNGNVADTVVNTTTMNFQAYVPTAGSIAFEYKDTKLSGTVAGKVYVQATLDPDAVTTSFVNIDSFTRTDITTNSFLKSYTTNQYLFWRLSVVPTGTSAAIVKAWVLRKDQR